jgi:hypothetical protein
MHVGQDDQPIVPGQSSQSLGGVRERRPVRDGAAQTRGPFVAHRTIERLTGPAEGGGEDVRIERLRRLRLNLRLVVAICEQQLFGGHVECLLERPRHEYRAQPRLPVDQGAVAVEAEGRVARQIQVGGHET